MTPDMEREWKEDKEMEKMQKNWRKIDREKRAGDRDREAK